MKNLITFVFVVFLISCGGGGSSVASSSGSSSSGAAPTGNFAGQVDPVQATD